MKLRSLSPVCLTPRGFMFLTQLSLQLASLDSARLALAGVSSELTLCARRALSLSWHASFSIILQSSGPRHQPAAPARVLTLGEVREDTGSLQGCSALFCSDARHTVLSTAARTGHSDSFLSPWPAMAVLSHMSCDRHLGQDITAE